ncbi:hypothetical protein BJ973_003801 [Actinoplanes tereljensis]|uniref:AMIN-like domain-containing protein n=1 Tax=Paractinoplanes tereljensis TaxID=571912 RepID=A0A919NUL3_9ACTN|nr:hypothetical protein [Actinoplanes tereljensis]GIF25524.1 hypothetical protein Ate02nite_82540 [Actinoplanes tereljensis]
MKGTKALIFLTALALVGGCGHATPRAAATSAPATTTPHTTEARQVAAPATSPWGTGPYTVKHTPPVPPVPVITGIRYAGHKDGFDRLVLDIPGALPGYSAKYVTEVRRDGSGDKVTMPGYAFIQIVLHPAQAHRDDGTPTVSGIHRTGLAGIMAYAVVGDYEGYVTIALGVSGKQRFNVAELSDRVYIDVAV